MYDTRNRLLDGENLSVEALLKMAKENITDFVYSRKRHTRMQITRYILDNISYSLDGRIEYMLGIKIKQSDLVRQLYRIVESGFANRRKQFDSQERMQEYMRKCALKAIEDAWVEQVDYLHQLQAAVRGRASAQKNIEFEYQKESVEAFRRMEKIIKRNIIRNIMLGSVTVSPYGDMDILLP